jgi:hypothetical protein
MDSTLYRITGLRTRWDQEQRKYVPGDTRTTVRRSRGDFAYYEDAAEAKRGLVQIKAQNRYYAEPRIEALSGEWTPVEP